MVAPSISIFEVYKMEPALKFHHLLPRWYIGGVERMYSEFYKNSDLPIELYRVYPSDERHEITSSLPFQRLFFNIKQGDVLISSLWISHVIAYLISRIIKVSWVATFHSSSHASYFDYFGQKLAHLKAKHCCYDCSATQIYCSESFGRRANTEIILPYEDKGEFRYLKSEWIERKYDILWVGRLSDEKQPHKALQLMNSYGKNNVFVYASTERKLSEKNILYFRNLSEGEIMKLMINTKYLLCTSRYEGAAIAAEKAHQCGCIIISDDVGEIYNVIPKKLRSNMAELESGNDIASKVPDMWYTRKNTPFSVKFSSFLKTI